MQLFSIKMRGGGIKPVRLMVINKDTDIDICILKALNQPFENSILKDYYKKKNIKKEVVDQKEKAICKGINKKEEIDVGSCDRWNLLYNMLQGLYTETNNAYGNFSGEKYFFVPKIYIKYELITETEKFEIEHKCAFINDISTRLIPIQENAPLTKN